MPSKTSMGRNIYPSMETVSNNILATNYDLAIKKIEELEKKIESMYIKINSLVSDVQIQQQRTCDLEIEIAKTQKLKKVTKSKAVL